ncbi:unnamed protein product [Miscanthus lutarioriparius]|uniref:Germin-like protein n=1 Tax=Miscanthus lutarioriparius TaxID=422564 RepID=A0A811PGM6_9POAL|nr:unnamed protein product [Miscanthus lutarioriparius]
MATHAFLLAAALLSLSCFHAIASDPSLLQDFCVVDKMSTVRVNGFPCKDAKDVVAEDFFFPGLHMAGNTTNKQGSAVTQGSLYVGFVTSNPDNKLFTKVLNKGDVFVFPEGLIHFQFNYGTKSTVALAALSSQNPGVITVANAVFGSKPSISDDVLAKAFQVDKQTIDRIQAQF